MAGSFFTSGVHDSRTASLGVPHSVLHTAWSAGSLWRSLSSSPSCLPPAGPGPVVKAALTEATLRRLQKLSDEDDFFTAEDY